MCKDYCTKFIEMILMVTADHGPAVSGAHNTIVTARAGEVGSKCMHSCQNCARIRARGFPLCSDMQYTQYMATKWCDLIWYTIICVDMYWLCSLLLIDTISYNTLSIYDSKDWFEKSWIAILSPCCWPVHHTPFEGKDLVSSLCSGLLTIGPRFGGALDDAAKMSLGDNHRWYLVDTRRHWAELGVQSLQKTDLSILKHELTRLPLRFADAQTSGVAPKDRHKDTLQSIPTTQNYTELRWLIMLKSRQTLNNLKFLRNLSCLILHSELRSQGLDWEDEEEQPADHGHRTQNQVLGKPRSAS